MAGILDTNLTTTPAVKAATPIGPAKPPVTDDQIKKFWTDNKIGQGAMKDADIADAMDFHGVTPERLSQVMGVDGAQVASRYAAVRTPTAGAGNTMGGATTGTAAGTTTTTTTPAVTTPATTTAVTPAPSGIIDTKLPVTEKLDSVKTYNPDIVKMEDADTVESRIGNIIKSDSPLMQLARTRALQEQNANGTLNSSMAIGAGQNAILDKALPIATTDATTSSSFKLANQGATNTANQFGAGEVNQAQGLLETGRQQTRNIAANTASEKELQAIRDASASALADKNVQAEKDLQASRNQSALDVANLSAKTDKELQASRDAAATALAEKNIQAERDIQAQRDANSLKVVQATGESQKEINALQNSANLQLTQIKGKYETLASGNNAAANAITNNSLMVNQVLANPDIPVAQKQQIIDQYNASLILNLKQIGKMAGIDYGDMLENLPTTANG